VARNKIGESGVSRVPESMHSTWLTLQPRYEEFGGCEGVWSVCVQVCNLSLIDSFELLSFPIDSDSGFVFYEGLFLEENSVLMSNAVIWRF
jgi:hypothetical protein